MKKGKEIEVTEYVRNADTREDFINKFGGGDYQKGYEAFLKVCLKDKKWEKLKDISIPEQYEWIFSHFLNIWQGCEWSFSGSIIFSFRTIEEYESCMKVPLRVCDKKLLLKMKAWACNQIAEMEEEKKL